MASDTNNSSGGGLSDSSIGHMGTRTRIKALSSPEVSKLRGELKAINPGERGKNVSLREILDRLEQTGQTEP